MTGKGTHQLEEMRERYQRPDWVRRINAMGDSLGDPLEGARRLVPLDAKELEGSAEASLGAGSSGDFGDPGWRERFRALVDTVDSAPYHAVGRLITRQELLRALRTRLLLARTLTDHPEIPDQQITAPLVVTGPARSGTSILYELLSLDPTLRAPLALSLIHI